MVASKLVSITNGLAIEQKKLLWSSWKSVRMQSKCKTFFPSSTISKLSGIVPVKLFLLSAQWVGLVSILALHPYLTKTRKMLLFSKLGNREAATCKQDRFSSITGLRSTFALITFSPKKQQSQCVECDTISTNLFHQFRIFRK